MVSRWIEGFRFCIKGLIEAPSVRSMQQFTQHGDVSTLEHCLMVAFLSYTICRMIGLNFYVAARGGLLHDLFLYDWHKPNPYPGLHGFSHPKIALHNAQKYFYLTPLEEEIIRTHMWPLTFWAFPKHLESFVVCSFGDLWSNSPFPHNPDFRMDWRFVCQGSKRNFSSLIVKHLIN